jgi:hypothetical protein
MMCMRARLAMCVFCSLKPRNVISYGLNFVKLNVAVSHLSHCF